MRGKANPSKKRITVSLTYLQAKALFASCDGIMGCMDHKMQPHLSEALGQLQAALERALDRDERLTAKVAEAADE